MPKVFVVGVGMTKFEKPGARDWDYPDMAQEAGQKALDDAGRYGTTPEQFAKIGHKNHKPSVNNPYSQFRGSAARRRTAGLPT